MTTNLVVDGATVEVVDDTTTLLDVLRDQLGLTGVKDGCSPQGQCGCCTVLVDGQARVACVTPVRRVSGRSITTIEGLAPQDRAAWTERFAATGASQCGFCTPGIIMRLAALHEQHGADADDGRVQRALAAHLCRCTGWQTITEAWRAPEVGVGVPTVRDDADRRATIEGRAPQRTGADVAAGEGGFAADKAPVGALVAIPDGDGGWAVGENLAEARRLAARVQGRRTTRAATLPVELPAGEWDLTLQTSWVEPGYLETDSSWCEPGGEPASALANGGAFGAKRSSPAPAAAKLLADRHGRPVRVLLSREDTVRLGPKRPPIAAGVRDDGSGVVRVGRTAGIVAAIAGVAPDLVVEEVDIVGPPTSADLRGAGWVEALVLGAGARGEVGTIVSPDGGRATATVDEAGISLWVDAGRVLDEVVLRSYCIGAAHMAYSWVTSEGLSVDDTGAVHDLTIRSFGIVKAADMPHVEVTIEPSSADPVNGSDAVFAAVAAATWLARGLPPVWPCG